MLTKGERLFAYPYKGYWKDVGTINSLWDANMELLQEEPGLNLYDDAWRIFSRNPNKPPHFVDRGAKIKNSLVSEGCYIYGTVENSILSAGVTVEKGAVVRDSIIMQETVIREKSKVLKSIVDEEVVVEEGASIGGKGEIAVVGNKAVIRAGATVAAGESVPAKRIVKNTTGGVS